MSTYFAGEYDVAVIGAGHAGIEAALAAGNLEESFELSHALKGVVGNLALTPIYNPLVDMTEMLRAKKDVDYVEMYKPIKEIRDKLVAEL